MYFTTQDIKDLIKYNDINIDSDGNIFFESFTIPGFYSTGLVITMEEKQHYSEELEIKFSFDDEFFELSSKQLEDVRNYVRDLAFEIQEDDTDTSSAFTNADRLNQESLINGQL